MMSSKNFYFKILSQKKQIFKNFNIFAAFFPFAAKLYTTVHHLHELRGIITLRKIMKNNERKSGYMSSRYFMIVISPISNYFPTGAINSSSCVLQEDTFISGR